MDKHALSPELEKEARALCAKITVAHDLDAEIQEELFSHVEDKLLGYLQGEVPVSDADALLLARAHFGDPAAIKGLLGDVHAPEAAMSHWRRLAAAAIATLGCVIAARLALTLVSVGIQYIHVKAPGFMESWGLGSSMPDASGALQLSTPGLVLESASGRWTFSGRADLDLQSLASRISTLDILGSYRLTLAGDGAQREGTSVLLTTTSGALQLSGNGQFAAGRLRFRGQASAAPGSEAALNNLLNIIGRRQGAQSVISIG